MFPLFEPRRGHLSWIKIIYHRSFNYFSQAFVKFRQSVFFHFSKEIFNISQNKVNHQQLFQPFISFQPDFEPKIFLFSSYNFFIYKKFFPYEFLQPNTLFSLFFDFSFISRNSPQKSWKTHRYFTWPTFFPLSSFKSLGKAWFSSNLGSEPK